MKLPRAALAAALAIVAGGPVHGSTEDDPDGIGRLLARLEQVVQQGDAAGYRRLLAEGADPGAAVQFILSELPPDVTRAVVHERDRAAFADVPPDTAYRLAVDVFEEFGNRARISTWRLDVVRTSPREDGGLEWAIADQAEISAVDDLYRLSLDAGRVFAATRLTLGDEDLELTLDDGLVFVAGTDQGTVGLVLVGRGRMTFDPAPASEKTQIRIFSGPGALETRFDAAFLRINPGDFDRLFSTPDLRSAPVDPDAFRKAEKIFHEDAPKAYSLELGDLSRDSWSLVPAPGDLVAEVHTRRFGTLTYSRSSGSREDVSLFDRVARKTIALYPSAAIRQRAAREPAAGGVLEAVDGMDAVVSIERVDFDIRHYDIDVAAIPDRLWIAGRTRMTVRVARELRTLTLRLAEPLVVESVMSEEYGRLFSMRVKALNSVVVSLPENLEPGAEVTLTIKYAGRLDPQRLNSEALGAAGAARQRSDFPESGIIVDPEPSFLYSNQIAWYPRAPTSHYATATLRITVPETHASVASGEPDLAPPAALPADGSTPARRTYLFHARQPLRYFSFVVSRLDEIRATTVDGLRLSVQANPGHAAYGRELADRAADIAGFYASLLDDRPYPSLTIALLEGNAPGGHSPGYFAVLNQPPSSMPAFAPRRDPAFFRRFPEYVLAHEVAHQWWGQAVGWRDYHEQWLSEGFAQYFAALYAEREYGGRVFGEMLRQMRQWAADETDQGPISLGSRIGHLQGDSRIFRAVVYNKGALVLHMLRQIVGDEAFFRGLRRFYTQSRFRSVTTGEFRTVMEEEAGRSLGRFFDGWIDGADLPRLAFSYRVEAGAAVLRIEQIGPLFDLPVVVTLQYADRSSADVIVPVTGRIAERRVPLDRALRGAAVSRDYPPLAQVVRN